ncbi:MAG TPA: SRPBCC family protein, partial [Nocardioidaceae bacterium]|nr:SRPBCC family protein [Nocardioidaceae bacterium]
MTETDHKSRLSGITAQLPFGRLKEEAQGLGQALTKQGFSKASNGVESMTGRLNDYAQGKSTATKMAANVAQGDSPAKAGVKAAASKVKDTVKEKLGFGGGGGKGKIKVTNILESVDVPVSREVAYAQWTQFEDFPTFMKKVENVDQEEDEKLKWRAQIFWSHRSWNAEIVDQVPNERIVWKSDGDKGSVDGAITFHELAPELTRILMVLEYHPKGLFEHTGNLWRAQGRRARLELKHFARHVSTQTILHQDELEGWQGEIHEGQVVEPSEADEEE